MSEFGPDAATGHGPAESRSPADAGTSWRFVSTQAGAHADQRHVGFWVAKLWGCWLHIQLFLPAL